MLCFELARDLWFCSSPPPPRTYCSAAGAGRGAAGEQPADVAGGVAGWAMGGESECGVWDV